MPSSPPNATSPPNNAPCSLPRSRENSNSPEIDSRRPSLKYIFAPLSQKAVKVTTPSTNKIILDYLLYLSIQSRLKQAHVELMELSTPLPENENSQSIEERKKRWMETARKAEQDKNAVEAIVAGILSSGSRAKAPSSWVDCAFEQRLHLCQLTNLVFGRFDATSTGQHVIAHNSTRRRRHEAQMMASVMEENSGAADKDSNDANKENGQQQCDLTKRRQQLFSRPIFPPFCRRHRFQNCHGCRSPYLKDKPNNALHMKQIPKIEQEGSSSSRDPPSNSRQSTSSPPPPAGLIEAIPTFLKTSADLLRRTLETNGEEGGAKPMIFAGQRVMGGGMPPRWYDLFLELLTQAAIESYLCDGQTGLEPIFEIFSYGDVEDEDEPDEAEDDENDIDNDNDNDNEDDEEEDREEDEWGVRAADHHLLFPKTRTMYLFKTQVREREKEFLVVEGDDLKQHFEKLAQRYPLEAFEKSMGEFIQMILSTTDVPALEKYDKGEGGASRSTSPELPSDAEGKAITSLPSVYKYPGDGSLLMPEIPDVEEDDQQQGTPELSPATASNEQSNAPYMLTRKRQASISQIVPEPKRAR